MKSPYYFNLWAEIGQDPGQYRTLSDLLKTLDELGVWQTTASYREGNAMLSNEKLVKMIEETPGAKERVIPCFELQPFAFVSAHEMEHLNECLTKYRPACLRIHPKTLDFRVRELEWVLEKLAIDDPVIFVIYKELDPRTDLEDMENLIKRFPRLKFVIQQAMWDTQPFVYDAMLRSPGIYIDTSWLHGRGNVKLFADAFGAERVLFSLGLRGNRGAAMAGLSWCDLPQEKKDAVAYDSFVNLFCEKDRAALKARRRSSEPTLKNRFWKAFLSEQPITDIPVVDAHTHLTPHNYRWLSPQNSLEEERDAVLYDMDRLGIDISVGTATYLCPGYPLLPQEEVLKVTEGYRDRFLGYVNFRTSFREYYSEEFFDEMMKTGYFIGIKNLPSYNKVDIGDEKCKLMFEYADKHGLPILIHTWDDSSGLGTAKKCGDAAKNYPNARVILGHSGGGSKGRAECEQMAQDKAYDNVYFEFCGSFTAGKTWKESLEKIDYHRVLFGTDTHNHDVPWELGRLLSEDIPDEALEAILGANAIRVLNLKLDGKRAECALKKQ